MSEKRKLKDGDGVIPLKKSKTTASRSDRVSNGRSDSSSQSNNNNNTTTNNNINNNNNNNNSNRSIVIRKIPNTIVISRNGGQRFTVDTPKTFIHTKQEIINHFEFQQNQDYYCLDLSNKKIENETTYQQFLQTADKNLIIVYFKGEKILENPEEIVVDITPSKNILLKAGTSEYNFSNAIAEFIDNSIQAVRNNPYGLRNIDITINKPNFNTNLTTIQIKDNGCGMDKDDLQRWATMGLSQADLMETENLPMSNSGSNEEISGLISRFGVGGKKAAFYLGGEIKVTTKVRGYDIVNSATISLEILNKTGDQDWRIPILVRAPTEQEKALEQFTDIIISNVSMTFDTFDQTIIDLKRDLAHIYYYYLHEMPKLSSHFTLDNIEESDDDSSSEDESENIEDEPMDIDSKKVNKTITTTTDKNSKKPKLPPSRVAKLGAKNSTNGFKIQLNGQDLSKIKDSMENLYIDEGKKFKIVELSVLNPNYKESNNNNNNNSNNNNNNNNQNIKVTCYLRYFPFIEEKETLPIPFKVLTEYRDMDMKTCPLALRKPGFEIFWNGRLISEAHIERLGFMSIGKIDGEKIEEKWVQRVKGSLFLSSDFPVTHNKMHIIKESAIFSNLIERSFPRNMSGEFRKWLVNCHKLDQEFQFEVLKYISSSNRTILKSISVAGTIYKPDDTVTLNVRPTQHGTIKSIFYVGKDDQRTSDFQIEFEKAYYKILPLELVACSRIKCKLSKIEFDKHLQLVKSRFPHKVKIYQGDKVLYPKAKYHSGEKIKFISAILLDKSNKEIDKKILDAEQIKIIFTVTYGTNREEVYRNEAGVYYAGSKVSFSNVDVFKKAGSYTFSFFCSIPSVLPDSHLVQVDAGEIKSIQPNYKVDVNTLELVNYNIGKDLPPIVINKLDNLGNKITQTISDISNIKIVFKPEWRTLSSSQHSLDIKLNNNYKIEVEDGSVVVKGLQILSGELGDDLVVDMKLKCIFDQVYSSELPPIHIVAGSPVSMDFSENLFDDESDGFMNSSCLPEFFITLLDKDRNTCKISPPKPSASQKKKGSKDVPLQEVYHIVASSSVLKDDVTFVSDEAGCFNITTVSLFNSNRRKSKPLPSFLYIQEDVTMEMETNDGKDDNLSSQPPLTGKRKLNESRPNSSNLKNSTSPIQFTLYLGEKELFHVEKTLTILPSTKPKHLVIYPMSDGIFVDPIHKDSFQMLSGAEIQFGVKVFSVGGGGRGPFEIPASGTLTANWTPAELKFQTLSSLKSNKSSNNMIMLPPLITEKMTKVMKYSFILNIDVSNLPQSAMLGQDGEDSKFLKLDKQFSIQTTGGAPSSFHLQIAKGSTANIRCDSEVVFEISLLDKKSNQVVPLNDPNRPIDPCLKLAEMHDQRALKAYEVKKQVWSEFNVEKQCYICKAIIIGFGELLLKVIDKSDQIIEHSMKITIIEGQASAIKINNLQKLNLTCAGGERIDDLNITICDTQGNIAKSVPNFEGMFEWVPPSPNTLKPFEVKSKVKFEKGEGKLKGMEISPECLEGTYQLNVLCKGLTLTPGSIFFNVSGKFSIKLLNETPIVVRASEIIQPLRIQLINPKGEAIKSYKETMKLQFHLKSYACNRSEQDDTIFVFDELRTIKKAGEFKLVFCHSDRGNLKIELNETITISPDPPSKLEMVGSISDSVSTNLFKSPISIHTSDIHGNKCKINGSVKAYIEANDQSSQNNDTQSSQEQNTKELPNFSGGNSEVKFDNNGDAYFYSLSLRENIGSSGSYKLCFYCSENSISPLKIEFFFQNSKEIQGQKLKLLNARIAISTEIQSITKEMQELDKEQNNIASKFDLIKGHGDEIFNALKPLLPEFKESKVGPTPEEVKNILNNVTKEYNDLLNSSRRVSSLPMGYLAKELSDIGRSDDKSGIIGLVSEILCCEDEKEAKILAKQIGKKFEAVVVTNKQKFDYLYNKYKNNNSPIYLISVDQMIPFKVRPPGRGQDSSQQRDTLDDGSLNIQPLYGAPTAGFIGAAVNRVQLRDRHEYLRKTLVWNLLKDSLIFCDVPTATAYRNYLVEKRIHCPSIICLENGEFLESSGFIEIGQKHTNHSPPTIGQIPIQDTKAFKTLQTKKGLLEDYKATRHKQYQGKKNDYAPQLNSIKEKKGLLESRKIEKQQELDRVIHEISIIEKENINSSQSNTQSSQTRKVSFSLNQ